MDGVVEGGLCQIATPSLRNDRSRSPLAARGKSRASTETGGAPGWQGARRENIGNI